MQRLPFRPGVTRQQPNDRPPLREAVRSSRYTAQELLAEYTLCSFSLAYVYLGLRVDLLESAFYESPEIREQWCPGTEHPSTLQVELPFQLFEFESRDYYESVIWFVRTDCWPFVKAYLQAAMFVNHPRYAAWLVPLEYQIQDPLHRAGLRHGDPPPVPITCFGIGSNVGCFGFEVHKGGQQLRVVREEPNAHNIATANQFLQGRTHVIG